MDSNLNIPKITKNKFLQNIKGRKFENYNIVKLIENYLLEKRGYIFQMPKPGSPVILLLSGGLDSTIIWAILLKKYKYLVYPIFFHRGEKRYKKEWESVQYFYKLFQKQYGPNCKEPLNLTTTLPPAELEIENTDPNAFHPMTLLETLDMKNYISPLISMGVLPYVYPFLATAYSRFLFFRHNIKIYHIFSAVLVGDGTEIPSQTFTALRSTMLDMCIATADYSWQFTSFALEKELGHYLEKWQLIKLGAQLKLPLEKTWSCYNHGTYQCGSRCLTCYSRKMEFKKAGIHDKTIYENDLDHKTIHRDSRLSDSRLRNYLTIIKRVVYS